MQDARLQRSSVLPAEESIVAPSLASVRKDFRDVRRNHLRLDSLDVLQEDDEEAIEMRTVMPAMHPRGQEDRSLTPTVAPQSIPVLASVEPHGNRFLPLRISSHWPAPIIHETIASDGGDDDDDRLSDSPPPAVRCRSCESLSQSSSALQVQPSQERSRSLSDLTDLKAFEDWEVVTRANMFCTAGMASPRDACRLVSPSDLESISKQQLFSRWKESERRLLNILQNVLREKRALEERLLLLQRVVLLKPP